MKRFLSILATLVVAIGCAIGLASCGNNNNTPKDPTPAQTGGNVDPTGGNTDPTGGQQEEVAKADYTATYQIAEENEDGDTVIVPAQRTPITSAGVAAAYGGSFGSFVDDVKAKAELYLNKDNTYTYIWYAQCGTEGESGYFPTFTFQGNVTYKSDVVVQVAAPTKATCVINAYGQFATNEEQIGYFGAVGYTTTESTTSNAHAAVPYGQQLLNLMSEGVFIVNPKTKNIEAFAAGTVHATTYQIASENDEGDTVMTAATGVPFSNQSLGKAYGNSFGSFVDDVQAKGYLVEGNGSYAYVWEVLCGTLGSNGYFPVFAWWGTATSSESGFSISAPTYGMVEINAYGQFATNEEQIGYFGSVGLVATSESTSCPASNVPYGNTLLELVAAGTYDADWNYTTGGGSQDEPTEEVDTTFYGNTIVTIQNTDKDEDGQLKNELSGFTTITFTTRGYAKVECAAYPSMNNKLTWTVTDGALVISGLETNVAVGADNVVITVVINAYVTQYYVLTTAQYNTILAGLSTTLVSAQNTDKNADTGEFEAEVSGFTTATFASDGYLHIECAAYPSMNNNLTWTVTDGALVITGLETNVAVGADKVVVTVVINAYVTQYYVLTLAQYNALIGA